MASIHPAFSSVVTKSNLVGSKLSNSAFFFGVEGRHALKAWDNDIHYSSRSSKPRATLTFDPATNLTKTKQRKHTVDPAAPDFLPLPAFEECFPNSTKEYRCFFFQFYIFIYIKCNL